MQHRFFSLSEIASWQLNPAVSDVELPVIQRGFVWKAKQVEDLWDSLMRGYPIGSFICSGNGDKRYLLMDGQQRATSIFLGHHNPYLPAEDFKAWSIKGELPVLWIDLRPSSKPSSNRYAFRLITRAHPWGYQAASNDQRLPLSDRRAALCLFEQHDDNTTGRYTAFRSDTVFPYDASFPLPLCFFLTSNCVQEVIAMAEKYLPDYFQTKSGGFEGKDEFLKVLRNELLTEIQNLLTSIKSLKDIQIHATCISDSVLQERNSEEEADVFVRINSAGTPLSADDLIYSIYKSILPESKELIEGVGMSFIPAPQMLSHIIRLTSSELSGSGYVRKLSVKEFKRKMLDSVFKENLRKNVEDGKLVKVIQKAIAILEAKNNTYLGEPIPASIVKQFTNKNAELFLFLIQWLWTHEVDLDKFTEFRILGKLLTFAWFEHTDVSRLWSKIDKVDYWLLPLNEDIGVGEQPGVHILVPPALLQKYFMQSHLIELFRTNQDSRWGLIKAGAGQEIYDYYCMVAGKLISDDAANTFFWKFISKIRYQRSLVMFCQRAYINSAFLDFNQLDHIEDTNVPWDWDHIYPSDWVYRKSNRNPTLIDWNGCNGNLRAISLEHNRSRKNIQAPCKILDEKEREQSFIGEDWQYWQTINDRIVGDGIDDYFRAVTSRMVYIYAHFWDSMHIGEMVVKTSTVLADEVG